MKNGLGAYQGGIASKTAYQGLQAIELESDKVKLIVIPELGAKIVSLLYKTTGKEWLIGSDARELYPVAYGSDFGESGISGWDECFPSILACDYPCEGPYLGSPIPDHGELWSIPWNSVIGDGLIACSVDGRSLPYTFTREISFVEDQTLRFNYSCTNRGSDTLLAFWCAHPLFATTAHSEVILPDDVAQILCVDGGNLLQEGSLYSWPKGDEVLPYPINRIGPASNRDSRKFYVNGEIREGHAGLVERNTGESIALRWSAEEIPYLGIWIDEGNYLKNSVCAIEPCNGFYDDLTLAYRNDKLMRIKSGEVISWQLDVRLDG
ncbi:DUF5107 domain-containing protein [Paenibacillus glycanilyticus]|uniref:DUF5107 domain-containing protein n=1 Tax=Paenibacillus glycanilyticus TaxID=126569 RepID=A0ABQ6GBG4_9BACL|nr:DUF5107 domain-containing protein [Paenibacillus glycanilyticus]GLX67007.1 hypothetical protein MU1_13510 [Paenibacillus glycanilyticus]